MCRSGAGARSDQQPTAASIFGGTYHQKRWPNHAAHHQQPCRGRPGPGSFDQTELILKRLKQYCGAVGLGGASEANLAANLGALRASSHSLARCQRVKSKAEGNRNEKIDAAANDLLAAARRVLPFNRRF